MTSERPTSTIAGTAARDRGQIGDCSAQNASNPGSAIADQPGSGSPLVTIRDIAPSTRSPLDLKFTPPERVPAGAGGESAGDDASRQPGSPIRQICRIGAAGSCVAAGREHGVDVCRSTVHDAWVCGTLEAAAHSPLRFRQADANAFLAELRARQRGVR